MHSFLRLFGAVAVLGLGVAAPALASHSFTDVPDNHPFHAEIGVFKATNITTGCTATTFCPQDFVRRQAMAAFIDLGSALWSGRGSRRLRLSPGVESAGWTMTKASSPATTRGSSSFTAVSVCSVWRSRTTPPPGPNLIGGYHENSATPGVRGATIAGGGTSAATNRSRMISEPSAGERKRCG